MVMDECDNAYYFVNSDLIIGSYGKGGSAEVKIRLRRISRIYEDYFSRWFRGLTQIIFLLISSAGGEIAFDEFLLHLKMEDAL